MLNRLIAHQILKEQRATKCAILLRKKVLPAEPEVAGGLIEQLLGAFRTRDRVAGIFKSTGEAQPRLGFQGDYRLTETDLVVRCSMRRILEAIS